MNLTLMIGRLTKDPQIRYTQGGMCWASFTLAVDNPGKDKGASYPNCKAFDKTAELLEKYGTKGRLLGITGHIQTGNYTNKDGQKVYTTDVITDRVEFLDKKQDIQADETDIQARIPEGFSELAGANQWQRTS